MPSADGAGEDQSVEPPDEGPANRKRLLNRRLILVLVAVFGTGAGFYLLLSVVPLYAASAGAGAIGAGEVTGALMLSTVATELATPWLLARFGYRYVFAAGVLLLGVPAVALTVSHNLAVILVICVFRGIGLAIMFVVSGALVAILVPPHRRGEGLGLMGVVSLIPSVIALPLGLWLAGEVGYPAVFVIGAVASLVGLAAIPGLPNRPSESEDTISLSQALRSPTQLRLSGIFAATTVAAGAVVTFLPLAVTTRVANLAAFGLFIQSGTSTFARWWAGRYGDRHGAERLLVPGVLTAGLGVFALVMTASPAAILVGMLGFGVGFGLIQNATLALMFERAPASGYGAVSAVWSVAYDAGLGVGGAGFAVVATQTGYPPAFAITAALTLCAIVPAMKNRKWRSLRTTGQ